MKRLVIIAVLCVTTSVITYAMQQQTAYQYRVYCITESANVYTWASTAPTTCPHNSAHVINPASVSIVGELSNNLVTIQQQTVQTGGYFKAETLTIQANPGPGVSTEVTKSWPFDISMLGIYFQTTDDQAGDVLNVNIATNQSIGEATADVAIGATQASVNSTVIANIAIGFYVTLTDGTNTDSVGRVTAIDAINNIIYFETPTVNSFSAATPTIVQITVTPIDSFQFGPAMSYSIGDRVIGASSIPANQVSTITYTNNSSDAKTLVVAYEYLY